MASKGQIDEDFQGLLKFGSIASIIAILGVAGFTILSFFTVPYAVTVIATSVFSGSMAYLMGISYGILNDLLAAQKNLPYFLLGHQPQQKSMIESNDVAAVGIAWGIAAVAPLATIAAIAFGAVTLVTGFFAPIPLFVLPVMALAIPVVVLIAHFHAQHKEKERLANPHSYAHMDWDNFYGSLNEYQIENLKKMSNTPEDKAAWFSNSDRNIIGFTYMPLLAIASLVTMVTLSSVSSYLPAVLFSPLLSTIIPVAFSVVIAAGVGASLIYLAVNHNKQVDNKYKLDFTPDVEVPGAPQQDQTVDPSYYWTLGKHRENQASMKQEIVKDDSPKPDYSIVNALKSVGGSPLHQNDKAEEITETKDSGLSLTKS